MHFEIIEVCCYAGYKSNERPISFRLQNKTYTIAKILDRWYEGNAYAAMPPLDYFKVMTEEGATFIIRYNRLFDKWSIAVFDAREQ